MKQLILYQIAAAVIEILVVILLRYINIWIYKLRKKASGMRKNGTGIVSVFIGMVNSLREAIIVVTKRHLQRGNELSQRVNQT